MTDKKYAHRIPSLMDEQPINFYPHLAEILGVNEAIVLQQIWFYINVNRQNESERHFHDDKWWVYNSYKQWNARYFPWLNPRAIQVVILNLEKLNILESMQGVEDRYDRRKWYTVNLKALEDVIQKASKDSAKSAPSSVQDLDDDNVQNLHDEIPETTTEETTEKRKDFAPATQDAFAPSQSAFDTMSAEDVCNVLNASASSSVQGPEISTPVESSTQRTAKTKDKNAPPIAPAPPAPRSLLAWIIDDVWSGQQSERMCSPGMSKRLIGPLMGTGKQIDNRLEPKATEEEIYAFGRWYRSMNPRLPMPMQEKVASWFGQFRAAPDYASRVNDAHFYVERLYRNPTTPTIEEAPVVYVDRDVAQAAIQGAMRAMFPQIGASK